MAEKAKTRDVLPKVEELMTKKQLGSDFDDSLAEEGLLEEIRTRAKQRIPAYKNIDCFCQKHHIRRLSFFGSVVRDDFGPQSDVDVLVEFEPGYVPGLDFFSMEAELSRLLGRKVDLQTLGFLSPEIRSTVLAEAVPAYEQA